MLFDFDRLLDELDLLYNARSTVGCLKFRPARRAMRKRVFDHLVDLIFSKWLAKTGIVTFCWPPRFLSAESS